jgi:polyisoprenoid-binding protein YceI
VRHPLRWFLIALVVVVLAGGGALAWYVFGDSAPAKPKLSAAGSTVSTSKGDSRPDGTWQVAKGKNVYVGYRIKELFGGATLKRDAVGRSPDATGTLTISNGEVRAARVSGTVSALQSDRAARDSYIHDHALESDRFPQATFVLSTPIHLPSSLRAGTDVHEQAAGRLTLHGTTKAVTVSLDARWDGTTIEVAGTAPVALADYGIETPHTPVVSVDDKGSFEVHLLFKRVT